MIIFCFIVAKEFLKKIGYEFNETAFFVSWLILSSISKSDQFPAPFNILHLGGYSILFIGGAISYLLIINSTSLHPIARIWLISLVYAQLAEHFRGRLPVAEHVYRLSIAIVLFLFLLVFITGKKNDYTFQFNFLGELSFLTYTFYLLHQQVGLFLATLLTNKLGVGMGLTLLIIPCGLFLLSYCIERFCNKIWILASKGSIS